MSDKIISLCYVSSKADKTTELCRIADYIDGAFVPYYFEPGNEFYAENRDLLYGSTAFLQVEEGSIAVFEWSTYLTAQNKWFTDTSRSEQSWCEVIPTKHGTVDDLISALKAGLSMNGGSDRSHDLILCCRASGNQSDGLYIAKSDAFCRDGKLFLNDGVVSLSQVRLDLRYAVGDCKCRSSKYDTRKYLAREDGCRVVGRAELKTKDEIIGEIIRQNITKDGLARKERQAARSALEKLDMPSIVEVIANRLQCSKDQAAKLAEEYVAGARMRLDSASSQHLIELLIENDAESVQRMRAAVQQQWDETQQEQIKAAQQRQAEATAAIDAIRKQIADAETTLQKTQERQAEAESKAEEALLLQEQIEAEIQKRLEGFKNDYASVLVENAVIASAAVPIQQSGTGNVSTGWTIVLPENATHEGSLEENIDVAVENWGEICANQEMARGLTLLSFAAYAKRQPLLLVGEGAIPVSDLISSSICGQPAIKIRTTGEPQDFQNVIVEIEKKPEAVICLINGLKNGYDQLRTLMQMCPHRMFVVTEMHAESLTMEPTSLFTALFPVFCDFFYTGKQVEELPTYDCSNELHTKANQLEARSIKQAKVTVSQWLSDGFYPPVVRERCSILFAMMNLLSQMLGMNANNVVALAVEFLFVPLLKCMRKEESLRAHIEESTVLDGDRKSTLISFIGAED